MKKPDEYEIANVTIQRWPWSQYCMDCKHGEFLESKTFNKADYICWKVIDRRADEHCQEIEIDLSNDLTVGDISINN